MINSNKYKNTGNTDDTYITGNINNSNCLNSLHKHKNLKKMLGLMIIAVIMSFGFTAYAGETADIVFGMVVNEYYPPLPKETAEEVGAIYRGLMPDNEKIIAMCKLLDAYTEYYPGGIPVTHSEGYEIFSYRSGLVLYVQINEFNVGVDYAFRDVLKLHPNKTIILDLTECPGGILTVMEDIADELVATGDIYTANFRSGSVTDTVHKKTNVHRKVIVLVGAKTASCAEILTAALRESDSALIVGQQTYGKVSVQRMRLLPNGGIITMTVGSCLTRDGNDINGTGITPDIILDNTQMKTVKNLIMNFAWGN